MSPMHFAWQKDGCAKNMHFFPAMQTSSLHYICCAFIMFVIKQGKRAREIIIEVENWLSHHDIYKLLSETHCDSICIIEEAITFIEEAIDNIDDLSDDVRPHKDIISVSKSEYKKSFPEYARVYDCNATDCETVTNFKFNDIPSLLKKSSVKRPVVITSVRKSGISGKLKFGKQYIVDSAEKEKIKIDYEHEGTGDYVVPSEVATNLFIVRGLLRKKISSLKEDMCLRYTYRLHSSILTILTYHNRQWYQLNCSGQHSGVPA
jgi:hypothetical protein